MKKSQNSIRVASSDREAVESGLADDLIDFVRGLAHTITPHGDFSHEVHYLHGPAVMVEFSFGTAEPKDVSRLAVLIKLVFGGVEVALA